MRANIDTQATSVINPAVNVIELIDEHNRVLIGSFSGQHRKRTVGLLSNRIASAVGTGTFLTFLATQTARSRAAVGKMLHNSDCLQLLARL
ncbi:hypothetical protein [Mycobacterium lepromatosis]|uniref:hypothetical protein n=1 Tax=Mycobacterium lepromatosis TaxID=480418 RepID=UPI000679BECA|nr:hypothetical protein [Mycobacterium lepromatosis]